MIYKNKHGLFVRSGTLDDYICREQSQYLKLFDLQKTDRFLDIGANIGATAYFIADKVSQIYCFEPDEDNFNILRRNVKHIPNVHIHKYALVGNNDLTREFFLNTQKNKAAHSFIVKRGRDKTVVDCKNINKTIRQFRINIIKIDVEGAEYELLTYMNFDNIDELVFEYHFNILKFEKYFDLIRMLRNIFDYVEYKKNPKKCWTTLVYCSNRR